MPETEAKQDKEAPDPLDGIAETLDHIAMGGIAQMTGGLSPITLGEAWFDWLAHLAVAPGKQMQLAAKSGRKLVRLADYVARGSEGKAAEPAIEPLPQDHRFTDPA